MIKLVQFVNNLGKKVLINPFKVCSIYEGRPHENRPTVIIYTDECRHEEGGHVVMGSIDSVHLNLKAEVINRPDSGK